MLLNSDGEGPEAAPGWVPGGGGRHGARGRAHCHSHTNAVFALRGGPTDFICLDIAEEETSTSRDVCALAPGMGRTGLRTEPFRRPEGHSPCFQGGMPNLDIIDRAGRALRIEAGSLARQWAGTPWTV